MNVSELWTEPGICAGEQASELESGGDSGSMLGKKTKHKTYREFNTSQWGVTCSLPAECVAQVDPVIHITRILKKYIDVHLLQQWRRRQIKIWRMWPWCHTEKLFTTQLITNWVKAVCVCVCVCVLGNSMCVQECCWHRDYYCVFLFVFLIHVCFIIYILYR